MEAPGTDDEPAMRLSDVGSEATETDRQSAADATGSPQIGVDEAETAVTPSDPPISSPAFEEDL
jgi:hypothetical protein